MDILQERQMAPPEHHETGGKLIEPLLLINIYFLQKKNAY